MFALMLVGKCNLLVGLVDIEYSSLDDILGDNPDTRLPLHDLQPSSDTGRAAHRPEARDNNILT